MRSGKLQFGLNVAALAGCLALSVVCSAQNAHPDRPPQHPPQPRVAPAHPTNPNRAQGNANRVPQNQGTHNNFNSNSNNNSNHGARNPNGVRSGSAAGYAPNTRQQLGVGAPRPWVDQMRDLSPQQRDRVLQNSRAFQNLSPDKQTRIRQQFNQWDRMNPSQQTDLRQKENTWRSLTPGQRDYIKNNVLPRWRQMPWDRQQVMKQKLSVLQNMPESARNQRLNDPNFTRGMSDEEKSTLQDLSHMHVGAPDPPGE